MRPALTLLSATIAAFCVTLSMSCSERPDPPAAGSILYLRHCASCHGTDGKGDGPVASGLVRRPSDLTGLARRNGGRFDERAVMAAVDGRREVAEHGPREMPVWGAVFERVHSARDEPWPAYIALLDVRSLVDYLHSIQEP